MILYKLTMYVCTRGVYGIKIAKLEDTKRPSAELSKFRRHWLVGI